MGEPLALQSPRPQALIQLGNPAEILERLPRVAGGQLDLAEPELRRGGARGDRQDFSISLALGVEVPLGERPVGVVERRLNGLGADRRRRLALRLGGGAARQQQGGAEQRRDGLPQCRAVTMAHG